MVKPSFQLRIASKERKQHWHKRKSLAHCLVTQEKAVDRQTQLKNAVEWCTLNGKRGWAAVSSGLFPLIKDGRAINRRIDGKVENGNEHGYCSILTKNEEEQLVAYVKNKNRYIEITHIGILGTTNGLLNIFA